MALTRPDIRQIVTRVLQDQLTASATVAMDSVLASINSELTDPGRLIAATTPSLVVTVGSGKVTNPNTSKNRVLAKVANTIVSFTGGTITFPSGTGTITVSPGTNASITIGASQFVAVMVQLDATGNLNLSVGAAAASLGAVVIPTGSSSYLSLGYIIVQSNGSSVIQNVTNAMLYQFGSGGGSGSGSGTGINFITNPDAEADLTGWSAYSDIQNPTITNASPGVFTEPVSTASYYNGMPIVFTTTGALPTGLTAGTTYYITNLGTDGAGKHRVSATLGGADINTSSAGSGTHTSRPLVPANVNTFGNPTTGLTFSRNTTTPLNGTADFKILQSNTTVIAGQGVSTPFTIDRAYQTRVLTVSCNFNADANFTASSGQTGSESDLEFFIWDVTNSILIPLTPKVITAKGTNNYGFVGTFQAANNSTSYRLALHVATSNAPATGFSFRFDTVTVGPQSIVSSTGAVAASVARVASYTSGSNTPVIFDTILADTQGAYNSSTGLFTCPIAGVYRVSTALQLSANPTNVKIAKNGTAYTQILDITATGNTFSASGSVPCNAGDTLAIWTGTARGFNVGSSPYSCVASFELVGGSSAAGGTNRAVEAAYYRSTTASNTANTPINFDTLIYDTHGAVTVGASWKFTAPVSGYYQVECTHSTNNTAYTIHALKNGTAKTQFSGQPNTSGFLASGSLKIFLAAGDTLALQNDTTSNIVGGSPTTGAAIIWISLDLGSTSISTADTVSAKYYSSSASNTPGADLQFNFDTKVWDTTNSVTTGSSWKFTAPIAGKYAVKLTVRQNSATVFSVNVWKNGVADTALLTTTTNNTSFGGATDMNLLAGDFIDIRPAQNGNSQGGAAPYTTVVSITRIGN